MAKQPQKAHAIALLSGGLDSILAIRLLKDQGVSVDALHFVSAFSGSDLDMAALARSLDVRLDVIDHTEDLIAAIEAPRYGFGRHLNPCIDCRARMLRRADAVRGERGAHVLVTGEVLGQRPMSQRREPMDVVARLAGVEGRLLRPLCARLLPPTEAETAGLVDRDRLLGLSGRSRKEQLALARDWGIETFLTPAGGCLLTHKEFAAKVRDAMEHGLLTAARGPSLRAGRHFRLDPGAKVVVGRSQADNEAVEKAALPGDALLITREPAGPTTLVQPSLGAPPLHGGAPAVHEAARWTAAYTKAGLEDEVEIALLFPGTDTPEAALRVRPAPREDLEPFRIK
jgi:hypothetical protein